MDNDTDAKNGGARCERSERSRPQQSAASADSYDDEDYFQSFEKHGFECGQAGDPTERGVSACGLGQLGGLRREDGVLVMKRDDPSRAQDRLAKPPQPEN